MSTQYWLEETGLANAVFWSFKLLQTFQRAIWQYVSGTFRKNCSAFDPVIPFLGNYPKDIMGAMETALCTEMFIRTLFLTAKEFENHLNAQE